MQLEETIRAVVIMSNFEYYLLGSESSGCQAGSGASEASDLTSLYNQYVNQYQIKWYYRYGESSSNQLIRLTTDRDQRELSITPIIA